MAKGDVKKSMSQLLKELNNVFRASYNLAPVLAIAITVVSLLIVLLAIKYTALMPAIVLIIVVAVSTIIYANTGRYGEAALALAAGLASVFTVNWSAASFIGFVVAWLGFSILAMFISGFKIAAEKEAIYRHAAVVLADTTQDVDSIERRLLICGNDIAETGMDIIDKAQVIRLFAFRRLPLDVIPSALRMTIILCVAAKAKPLDVGSFVADTLKLFGNKSPISYSSVLDTMYDTVKKSPVPPEDFFLAFNSSRHLVLSRQLDPTDYFAALRSTLERGIQPSAVGEVLENEVVRKAKT